MTKMLLYSRIQFAAIVLAVLSVSCENNIEVIKSMSHVKELPSASAYEMEILYSDSAKVKMRIVAPVLNKFALPEKQYLEFPKGITVYQYDSAMHPTATVKCNFAIFHEKTKIWEARNDVVVKNLIKNEQLNTEELFWDQNKGIIYSLKFTKITNATDVLTGDNFTAKEDLSNWKLLSGKGNFTIKDTLNETESP